MPVTMIADRLRRALPLFIAALALGAPPSLYPQSIAAGDVPIRLEQVEVTGTADQGYRVGTVPAVGPWDAASIQDLPYAINVTSSELIDNRIFSSTDQIFASNPAVQLNLNQSRGYDSIIYIRGL